MDVYKQWLLEKNFQRDVGGTPWPNEPEPEIPDWLKKSIEKDEGEEEPKEWEWDPFPQIPDWLLDE